MSKRAVCRRVDPIRAGPYHRDTAPTRAQAPPMRGGIDPQGKPADDGESGAGERSRKCLRIVHSLRRRVSAADDRNRWPVEKLAPATVVERWRRGAYGQQRARIVGVIPRGGGPGAPRRTTPDTRSRG